MLGTFIDTIVVCSMTALVILTTGAWTSGETGAGAKRFKDGAGRCSSASGRPGPWR